MKCHHILVIEDEADIRETLQEMLELAGFHVFTAENGQEGLKLLKNVGEPCLILLDLMMPVMNGWEFLERLEKEHRHILVTIPVTVVSAVADAVEAQNRYGCRVLKKPVRMEHLIELAGEHCEACG